MSEFKHTEVRLGLQVPPDAVLAKRRVWFWRRASYERDGWVHVSGRVRPLMHLPISYIGGIDRTSNPYWRTRVFDNLPGT